ncbi:autotransporter-associated N-terminal domain-containing protein [Fusobacterium sp. PH5-44]|uniref:autotransporter-associated N-terminal domain-containing protein n=1 Tax=unclassified Fusobacterium TaxID=2648384 RepID=UPI003D1C22B1
MKDNLKSFASKTLKSFLKKKKIGYTAALLTAFLITGGIGLASSSALEEQVVSSQEQLLSNIAVQKAEIQDLIEQNEKALKEAKLNHDELIRKGDFYSKPVYPSTQIFFSYGYDNSGKGKDNTRSEWANTLEHIAHRAAGGITPKGKNPYSAGEISLGLTNSLNDVPDHLLDKNIEGNMGTFESSFSGSMGLLTQGNGVHIDHPPYAEALEIGANIKPLNPDLPVVNKNISINVATPNATGPAISVNPPSIPTPPTAPTVTVNVNVTPPAAVNPINVGAVTVAPPNVPNVGKIEIDEVTPPAEFEPSIAVMPEAPVTPVTPTTPAVPVVIPVGIVLYNASTPEAGCTQGSYFYWDNNGGNGGLISDIILESGSTWNIKNFTNNTTNSPYDIQFVNYTARTPKNSSGTQVNTDTSDGISPSSTSISGYNNTFTNVGSSYLGIMRGSIGYAGTDYVALEKGSTVNIDATNRSATGVVDGSGVIQMRQFIHYDPDKAATDIAGNHDATIDEKSKLVAMRAKAMSNNNNAANIGRSTAVMLKGDINVDGAGIAVLGMMTNHPVRNDTFAINTGNITIEGDKHAVFAKTQHVEVVGTNSQYMTFANTTIDGNTGKIIINANNSAVLGTFGFTNSTSQIVISFFNDGIIEIKGDENIGLHLNGMNGGTVELNTPIKILGGVDNKGIYQVFDIQCTIAEASILKVDITGGERNVGYFSLQDQTLNGSSGYVFNISEANLLTPSQNNVAVYSEAKLDIGYGKIKISGGLEGIGLYAHGGNITTTGSIQIDGGASNVGAYATEGKTIFLNGTGSLIVNSTTSNGGNILLAASPKILSTSPIVYGTSAGTINAPNRTLQVGIDDSGVSDGNDNIGIYVRNASAMNKATVQVDKIRMSGTGTGNIGVFVDETGGVVDINNTNSTIDMDGISGTGLFIKAGNLEGTIKQIDISDNSSTWTTSGNVGIFVIENGNATNIPEINIYGGKNNVGLFSNDYSSTINNLKVEITSKDNGNVGVFAGTGTGTKAEITLTNLDIDMKNNGTDNSGNNTAIFAQGIKDASTTNDGIINLTSGTVDMAMDNNGIALFAKDDGVINVNGGTFALNKSGASIAVNEGTVNVNGGIINYDGNGYVLYFTDYNSGTPVGGSINLSSGAVINVKGNATLIRRDWADALLEAATPPGMSVQKLGLTSGAKIKLENDGITLFGFGNLTSPVVLSTIKTVTSKLKDPLLTNLVLDPDGHSYKDAKLFDVTFEIDTDLTINGNNSLTPEEDGDYFKNSLALQRVDLILKSGKTVDVDLSDDQLVGLEMTSAYSATGPAVGDTRIELESGSTLTVDRTALGSGTELNATGIYMNYGEILNDGTIKVNTTTPANSTGAVGIYAENGSEVKNNGLIEVAGNDAIGIYGRPSRTGDVEFEPTGLGNTTEGIISIENNGTIDMSNADNSVGIFIDGTHGGTNFGAVTDNYAENTTGGIINTGKTTIASGFASGMYGSFATLENNGQINVNTGAAGIFASNSTKVTSVGNIDLANTAIALVMDKSSYNASAAAITPINVTTTAGTDVSSAAGDSGTVLYLKSDSGSTLDSITNSTVITSTADNITHVIADNIILTNAASQTLGASSIGFLAVDEAEIKNNTTIDTTSVSAIGMAITEKGKIINDGTIDFSGSTSNQSIAMLGSYDSTLTPVPTAGLELVNTGDIKLAGASNAIGTYLKSDTAGAIDLTTNIDLIMDGASTQQIGVYSVGENDIHLNAGGTLTAFSYANALNNILVYAKDGATIDTSGTQITIIGTGADGPSGEKTIGIYLENDTLTNTFDSSAVSLAVDGGAIGIYSKGGNTLVLGGLGTTGLEVTGDKTVGAYIVGDDTISGGVKITGTPSGNPVGIYNNGSLVTIDTNEFLIDIGTGIGTGMYATNGGYFSGLDITVLNNHTDANIGVYYTKGTGSTPVAHDTNIIIDPTSTEVVGIYADGGIYLSLNTSKAIEVEGTNSIGAMVNGTSTFTNNGSINQDTATGTIGIYAVDGTGVNNTSSTIIVDYTDSMGMVSAGDAGKTATIENKGTLAVNDGIGMVVGTSAATTGTSVGKNNGIINVTSSNGTGVVVETGAHNTFNGAGGTINVIAAAAGVYLDGTVSGQIINTGTLNLMNSSATGIFADNGSLADFDITMTGTAGIGLFADNGTIVSKIVDGSASTDTVAMYITDSGTHSGSTVTFTSGAKIITGTATSGNSAIGLLMDNMTYNLSNAELIADGTDSIASAVVNSTVNSTATMTLDNNAVGAYVDGASTLNFDGTMNLGDNTVGAYVDGGIGALGATGATVAFNGNDAVAMYAVNGGSVTLGSNITSSGRGTLAASENGTMVNMGTLTVENQAIGMVGLYNSGVTPGEYIENQSTGNITVKTGGIGMAAILYAPGTPPSASDVSVINNGGMSIQDQDSVGMFATVGTVQNNGTLTVTDNGIGIYVKDDANIGNLGTINVTSGVGYVAEGLNITGTGTINLNQGTTTNYSIGGYYLNVNSSVINVPSITQADYSIVLAIDGGSSNTISAITGGTAGGKNQIGAFVQNTDVTFTGITTVGDENIGAFIQNGTVNGTGTISTGISSASADKSAASIGMYFDNSILNGSADTLNTGDNTVGIYGKNSTMTIGTVNGGIESVGIYTADGGKATITNSLTTASKALGAFAKNADVEVNGNMSVGADTAVGIVSQGTGDVTYIGGTTTVANQATSASIAIYKGTGRQTQTNPSTKEITETGAGIYTDGTITASGTMSIGDGGYAIYADNNAETFSTGTIRVNNSADINLGMSSVGIYGGGSVSGINTGIITVGTTYFGPSNDHTDLENQLNSIGVYGENGANLTNAGTINVENPLSVGAYIVGANTVFTNTASGTINVDKGGVGILTLGSTINNYGVINTGYNESGLEDVQSIGIAAYASGTNLATVNNYGRINVGEGVGVYLGGKSTLNNSGDIFIDNGIGVYGDGIINNSGRIEVISGGAGSTTAQLNSSPASHGAITVDDSGVVVINNQYIHSSGTFVAKDLVVNGSTVSILGSLNGSQTAPHFVVDTIDGIVKLDSNFIKTGNGYGWSVDNFVTMATAATTVDLTITTSPLFVAHMTTGGGLEVAKQPYAYLVSGTQFDNLYNGLDSLLALDQKGTSNDSVVLKNLNAYLDEIYNTYGQEAFNNESSRTLAETRGDVYATIGQRMNNVQTAFDKAFDELVNSHNFTKDTGKYSVIYQQGEYKDNTLGIDDYDYKVTGLLYMREHEGRKYNSKWGYSFGFAVSRFDFDDAPTFGDDSKEDIYSLRAGIHNVHTFDADDTLTLRSRLEIGYNRHETERTLELDKAYKNKGEYNSYNVSLDNRLSKTLYRSLRSEIKVYGDLNIEYGRIDGFTEKAKGDSGLELKLKQRDYYSVEAALGVQGSTRAHLGGKMSLKLSGDLAYGYDLGNSYDKRVKAKVDGGTEGWYNLIRPEEEKGHIKGVVGLTLEKADNFGVTLELDARKYQHKKDTDLRYGLRFNYKFSN